MTAEWAVITVLGLMVVILAAGVFAMHRLAADLAREAKDTFDDITRLQLRVSALEDAP